MFETTDEAELLAQSSMACADYDHNIRTSMWNALVEQMSVPPEKFIVTQQSSNSGTLIIDNNSLGDNNTNTKGLLLDFDLNEDIPERPHCDEFASTPEAQLSKQKDSLEESSHAMTLEHKIVSQKWSKLRRKRLQKRVVQSKFHSIEQLVKLPKLSQSQMRKKGVLHLSLHVLSSRSKKMRRKQKALVGSGQQTTDRQTKRKQRISRKHTKKRLATSVEDSDETSLLLNFQRESLTMTRVAAQMHLSQRASSANVMWPQLLDSPESCNYIRPGKATETANRRSSICLNNSEDPPAVAKRSKWPESDASKVAEKTSTSVDPLYGLKGNPAEVGRKGSNSHSVSEQLKSGQRCQKCSCENAKCLESTCQCYMSQAFCLDCHCPGCLNQPDYLTIIQRVRKANSKRKAREAASQLSNITSGGSAGIIAGHSKSCRCNKCKLQKKMRSEEGKRRRLEHAMEMKEAAEMMKRRCEDGKERWTEAAANTGSRGIDLNAGTPEDAVSLRVVHAKWCKCETCQPPNQSSPYAQSSTSPALENLHVVHTQWTRPTLPDLHQPIDSAETRSMRPSASLSIDHPKWCTCLSCTSANSGTHGHFNPLGIANFKDSTRGPISPTNQSHRPVIPDLDLPVDDVSMNAPDGGAAVDDAVHSQWCQCEQCKLSKLSSPLSHLSRLERWRGDEHHPVYPPGNPSRPEDDNLRSGVTPNLHHLLGRAASNVGNGSWDLPAGSNHLVHSQWCKCEQCNIDRSSTHSLNVDQPQHSPFHVASNSLQVHEHIEQKPFLPKTTAAPPSNLPWHDNVQPGTHSPQNVPHSDSHPIAHYEDMHDNSKLSLSQEVGNAVMGVPTIPPQPPVPLVSTFKVPERTTLALPNTTSREKWLNFSRTKTSSNFGMDISTFKKNAASPAVHAGPNPLDIGPSDTLSGHVIQSKRFTVPPKMILPAVSSTREVVGKADIRDLKEKPI